MKLEHIACDLCGCEKYSERYRKPDDWLWLNQFEYPIVECLNCGLVYVNPRPAFEDSGQFYPTDYHHNRNDDAHLKRYELQFSYIKGWQAQKVLDIGCARGDWLNFIQSKWLDVELHGVDAFSSGVDNKQISFQKCQLPDAVLAHDYFDLITSWAVFEHLHTPLKYFEVVSKILRKGGRFIFLVTNSESCYGKYAYKEDIPRHLYHFNEKNLGLYADKSGLKLEKIYYDDSLWDGRGWGTFRFRLGHMTGVTWQNLYFKKVTVIQHVAMKLGNFIDKLVFSTHWEAKLGRSGIMVVVMGK